MPDVKLSFREMRRRIRELEEAKPKNIEEYKGREEKIRKLLEQLSLRTSH